MVGRRIVTGIDGEGRSVVTHDGPPATIAPPRSLEAFELEPFDAWRVWATDPANPELDGPDPIATLPAEALDAHVRWGLVAFPAGFGANGEGWHSTPTIDLVTVVSGEIVLALDDAEIPLASGDLVVQRGTRHAWRNRGAEPCVLSVVTLTTG
jgi:mannose-6-phosphate isomerase-like protein (cupin superfamily)